MSHHVEIEREAANFIIGSHGELDITAAKLHKLDGLQEVIQRHSQIDTEENGKESDYE